MSVASTSKAQTSQTQSSLAERTCFHTEGRCYNCKELGHLAAACPKPKVSTQTQIQE